MIQPFRFLATPLLAAMTAGACAGPPSSEPRSLRLVDVLSAGDISGKVDEIETPRPSRWRFDGSDQDGGAGPGPGDAVAGWKVVQGARDLRIQDGLLVGRTTADNPILRFERLPVDDPEPLHEIRIRMSASAGTDLALEFATEKSLGVYLGLARDDRWSHRAPIVADGELRTFTVRPAFKVLASDVQYFFVRPTNAADADFAVESLRLVFRREHLAAVPSGLGWHELAGSSRETVVTRSPETIRWPVALPDRPRLEMSVGTIENAPVTFRASARTDGVERRLLRRTVTTPYRWEDLSVDLDDLAGREVELVLAVESETPGALGFWGSPAVRRRLPDDAPPGDRPQGVILILADTLRPDHLDAYGYPRPTAPALRALAEEGVVFRDTVAQGTWTKVSVPSLLTSLYPHTAAVLDMHDVLPSTATTLAEVYREAGYATVAYSSVEFVGRMTNLHQGFEAVHQQRGHPHDTAKEFVGRLTDWLERHRDVPFFALLHVFDPHSPYEPAAPENARWADPGWHDEYKEQKKKVRPFIREAARRGAGIPTRRELADAGLDPDVFIRNQIDWYDGSLRAMDVELSRLFDRLVDLGLDAATLTVFTSDHGEEFFDHGRTFHGQSVYAELTQVPLVFRRPGHLPAGAVVGETVQLLDVMPTLLELSGLPVPARSQGRSLVPLLNGAAGAGLAPRPAFSVKPPSASPLTPTPHATEERAIVYEGWKLIAKIRPDGPHYELFDRGDDPREQNDVAAEHPETVERLATLLEDWLRRSEAEKLPSDDEAVLDMSADQIERLRALGYVN